MMIYFLEVFECQCSSHQGNNMFSARLGLSIGTQVNFWYTGEFGEVAKGMRFLGFLVSVCSAFTPVHQVANQLCNVHRSQLHVMPPFFCRSTENGNLFSGRLQSSNTTVNFSKSSNQCILLFLWKCSNVWRLEFWCLNSVLFFTFTCSVVNVLLWSNCLTVNKGEENWSLRIKLFFFMCPKYQGRNTERVVQLS